MSDHLQALPSGTQLGEYSIESVLGSGGFGVTYLARDTTLGLRVAIKEYLPSGFAVRVEDASVLPKSASDREVFDWGLDRFLGEGRTLAKFSHPNIVSVHKYMEANGTGYLVMEYVEGETLSAVLKRTGPWEGNAVQDLLNAILGGLKLVHDAGYLHRDIKPGNIVMRPDGSPVLIDFGAARMAVGAKSQSISAIFTAGYAPFEQYNTRGSDQGPWTDIYALAAVAYKCLTFKTPHESTNRVYEDHLVPASEAAAGRAIPSLLHAIDHGLAVRREHRPQDIAIWQAELNGDTQPPAPTPAPTPRQQQAAPSAQPGAGRASTPSHTPSRQTASTNRKPWLLPALAGTGMLLLIGSAIALLVTGSPQEDVADTRPIPTDPGPVANVPAETDGPAGGNDIPATAEPAPEAAPSQAQAAEAAPDSTEEPEEPEPQPLGKAEQLAQLETQFKEQLGQNKLTKPPGDSAAETLDAIKGLDSAHPLLESGGRQIAEKYLALFERELKKNRFDRAERYLELARRFDPEGGAVEAAGTALAEAREAAKTTGSLASRRPGQVFRDCPECPEMVVLPRGSYQMGSPSSEAGRYEREGPLHTVRINYPLAMGKTEVTFRQWDACVADGGCNGYQPDARGWGRENRPVMNVSWENARTYAKWLSQKTGHTYRLPSEAEWEYAARGGTQTARYWGDKIGQKNANCDGCGSRWDGSKTAPVGSFRPNRFGLYDMLGNVWEWTQDCWTDSYAGAPRDGSAWIQGDCGRRVVRGGAWFNVPRFLRAADRVRNAAGDRGYSLGFRLARTD